MSQTLVTFEKALKENYLPAWRNQLGIEPSALLSKVRKVPLKSNKIVATAPVGLSGGFGFGAEGAATPAAGGMKYDRFETTAKDMYVNIGISAKAVRLTDTAGAMANALDVEVKGAYDTAKWNVGRALFGNGTGVLTTISILGSAGNTVTVADVSKVKEGLIIDFYATGAGVGSTPAVAGRRITAVDRVNKTITFSGAATTLAAGFITIQNSYGREITGLGAIFDSNVASIYGMAKSTNPYLNPIAIDGSNDIDDGLVTKALRRCKVEKNSDIDMLLCGDDAFDNYVNYLRTSNQRIEDRSTELKGGFKAIKFVFGNKIVELVNEQFVPTDEMWGIDSSTVELHSQEWNFADLQGGGIFNLLENTSIYRALLVNFGDLICTNPGGCLRLFNLT